MHALLLPSGKRYSAAIAICFVVVLLFCNPVLTSAQEAYLVTAVDGSLSLYDLSTNNLIETITSGLSKSSAIIGPNNRLAFVSSGNNLSVIDLTIGREIKRIQGLYVNQGSMTFTPDGRWLLFADDNGSGFSNTLDIFDPARMELIRRIPLAPAMGYGAASVPIGSIMVVGEKAYVAPIQPDYYHPTMAVVDLRTFRVRPISIPYLNFDGWLTELNANAAATPDGKYVAMVGTNYNDDTFHLLLISTTSDSLASDIVMTYEPLGIVIPPSANPAYGYVLAWDPDGYFSATVLDLRNGSPTFGQLLPATEVNLNSYFYYPSGEASDAAGSRLVVTGYHASSQGPQPNTVVVDTALMLTNPSQAVVATPIVASGAQTNAVTVGSASTTPPTTAPTVTGVSGTVTNDTATTIHVFGTHFASGAQVRIGSMAPLNARVNSSTDLQITVPVAAPAAPALDVIVTNPAVTSPPAQQNQSGVLAGGLTIKATSAFQTTYQFAAKNSADGSVSVYDANQRAMVNVAITPPGSTFSLAFNAGGTDLYIASNGFLYAPRTPTVVGLHLANDMETAVTAQGNRIFGYLSLAASVNPATGGSVVYEWTGYQDIAVNMVDTNPSSPTFNTVINTLYAGLSGDIYLPYNGAATPDGKFVYVDFYDEYTGEFAIAIFDVVHGGAATIISTDTLGVSQTQFDMYVAPDGKSLLLNSNFDVFGGSPLMVFDIGVNPKNPTLVTTIRGTSPNHVAGAGPTFLYCYQVVGSRLFAFDFNNNVIMAFNFDRQHGNYTQLGANRWNGYFAGNPYIAVSPDGNLLYLPFGGDDMISVYDANKLARNQAAFITNLAAFHGPDAMTVNPVSGSDLLRRKDQNIGVGARP
ncbi:MAG: WD40 repeat domain-containing protein [Candidatus Korobacteraceae bacterium]